MSTPGSAAADRLRKLQKLDTLFDEFDSLVDHRDNAQALEIAKQIFLLKSDLRTSFSKWRWSKVCAFLGISPQDTPTLWDVESARDKIDNDSAQFVDDVLRNMKDDIELCGEMSTGHETKKVLFAYYPLKTVLLYLKRTRASDASYPLKLGIETQISGDDAYGPVEFVVFEKNLIVSVIKVKRDDLEQGKAQLFMQLYTVLQSRPTQTDGQKGCVTGFVTTGHSWIPFFYDGNKFQQGREVIVDPLAPKKSQVEELLATISVVVTTSLRKSV